FRAQLFLVSRLAGAPYQRLGNKSPEREGGAHPSRDRIGRAETVRLLRQAVPDSVFRRRPCAVPCAPSSRAFQSVAPDRAARSARGRGCWNCCGQRTELLHSQTDRAFSKARRKTKPS